MRIIKVVIVLSAAFISSHLCALTPAESLLVERIKEGVSLLVEENPAGWKTEAHKLVNEIEKSYDPSERTQQQMGVMKQGTPPPLPGGAMKKGGPPAPPGPMQKGAAKKPGEVVAAVQKAPETLKQIFSKPKLSPLSDGKLLELYAELLADLPKNWNGQVVEKVEEKTKYGAKVYNVYGAPVPKWKNDINTLKSVLVDKGIKTKDTLEKEIVDRIVAARAEKNVRPAAATEEKASEELTEADIVKLIQQLLAAPKKTEMGWMVSIKGNIKTLFKLNQSLAREYENKFIRLAGEKRFLPIIKQTEPVVGIVIPKVEIE